MSAAKHAPLAAAGLECAYGSHRVLADFSLTLAPGEILAVLGPNGAGKTTALRALARLLKPRRGRVTLLGEDVWRLDRRLFARKVAFVPQFQDVSWPVSVAQLVALGRAPHRGWILPFSPEDRRVVEQVLEQTGLTELRSRLVHTLSGGERQRVVLARALAQRAQVLLLDEPTAHLDLRFQLEILELVAELARGHGLTVVLCLHDLNQAARYADRIALLESGKLVALGAPAEVLTVEALRRVYKVEIEVLRSATGEMVVLPLAPAQSQDT